LLGFLPGSYEFLGLKNIFADFSHAKRTTINVDDVLLLARNNQSIKDRLKILVETLKASKPVKTTSAEVNLPKIHRRMFHYPYLFQESGRKRQRKKPKIADHVPGDQEEIDRVPVIIDEDSRDTMVTEKFMAAEENDECEIFDPADQSNDEDLFS